jgi:hypothetical protein
LSVKFYIARIKNGRRLVDVIDRSNKKVVPLETRPDLINYRGRFSWGKDNEGAWALSLAMLANALDNSRAVELHRNFAARHLSNLRQDTGWHMSDQTIRRLVEQS